MYLNHFGLNLTPFSIVPDHRVLYMSDSHRDAVAHLLYALRQSGGFVQLTGEVGTGKTTVCRYLLSNLPEDVDVALLLNPRINEKEMLESICDELKVAYGKDTSIKGLIMALNLHLLRSHAAGRHTVLIIDEAQNLATEVLEQVRLLTNLETSTDKLLQIILIGQPELAHTLSRHDMRQLSQRIVGRFQLEPLKANETREYIEHRLNLSGARNPIFTRPAISRVHALSGGIPRLINVICDRSLLGAYSAGNERVTKKTVDQAGREILPSMPKRPLWQTVLKYVAIALVPVMSYIIYTAYLQDRDSWFSELVPKTESVAGQDPATESEAGAQSTGSAESESAGDDEALSSSPITDGVGEDALESESTVAADAKTINEPVESASADQIPGQESEAGEQGTLPGPVDTAPANAAVSVPDENRNTAAEEGPATPEQDSSFDLGYRLGVPLKTEPVETDSADRAEGAADPNPSDGT